VLADELAGAQVKNLASLNGGVEAPIKILQRFEVAKAGGLLAPFQKPLLAHVQFVLQEQFQELNVRQLMGAGFL